MRLRHVVVAAAWVGAVAVLAQCGSSPATPTVQPTPGGVAPSATPAPAPTPGGSSGLPPGMVCGSPTPPPILRMHVKVHDDSGGRKVLDSKPLVANVDHYCDKVGFGDWKFCDTRPEGHPERQACDYLVTGKAEDTGRWGPTWFYNSDLCSLQPAQCALHATEQFLVIAKNSGRYTACAREDYPVAPGGDRCGWIEIQ